MRKAASHKVGYLTLAMFIAIAVMFSSVTRAVAYSPDPNEVPVGDQDINDTIIGFITIDGNHAKATVENTGDATESGGLASYSKKNGGDTEDQVLYASIDFTLEPHSKKDLVVELPCYAQVDLFKGSVIQNFNNGARYGSRLVYAIHTKDECASPSITPTATPVVTSTPSPTSTPGATPSETPVATPSETPGQGGGNPTPTPTESPAPTSTPTSTPALTDTPNGGGGNGGSSTPSGQVLGSSIPQGGLTLPSTGGTSYDFLAFAAYIMGAGITLRKYAHVLDASK